MYVCQQWNIGKSQGSRQKISDHKTQNLQMNIFNPSECHNAHICFSDQIF